jgi:hypothetical protein
MATNQNFRKWTEGEVEEAISYVQLDQPSLWDAIVRREQALQGLGDEGFELTRHLRKKYPDANHVEITFLLTDIRVKLHKQFHPDRK